MITSDRQKKQLEDKIAIFQHRLKDPAGGRKLPKPVLVKLTADIQATIDDLQSEVLQYESAQQADVDNLVVSGFDQLQLVPIIVRLANHMSLRDFALTVDEDLKQITRWESREYAQCTMDKINGVISTLKQKRLLGKIVFHDHAA
jgi:hypothetical protein